MNSNAGRGFLKAVLIVGFVFAIAYFISYNNWTSFDFNKVDITYNYNDGVDNNNNKTDDNKNSDEFKELYTKINFEFLEYNFGEEFYDIYYGNKEFTNQYFVYVGIVNLINNNSIVNCNLETKISKAELKNIINSLFGNVSYNDESFTTKNGHLTINYNSKNEEYEVKLNGKCSGFDYSSGGVKTIFQESEVSDNTLYIYEKALYLESMLDYNGNLVYNYHEDVTRDSKIISNSFNDVNIELLPTYVFEFKKINNSYTLQKITKK